MPDISSPDYWNALYLANDAGWDKGRVSPPIARMVRDGLLAKAARVAVVGAGRGHEAIELARAGLTVTAIDFAEEAAKAMRAAAEKAGVAMEVLQEDVFALPRVRPAAFDAACEHTCFCAIDPARRAEYVEAIHGTLAKGGLFFGLFYAHDKPGGPPHTTTEAEVRTLFTPRFAIERLVIAPDSFPNRQDAELEFVFRRAG